MEIVKKDGTKILIDKALIEKAIEKSIEDLKNVCAIHIDKLLYYIDLFNIFEIERLKKNKSYKFIGLTRYQKFKFLFLDRYLKLFYMRNKLIENIENEQIEKLKIYRLNI